MGRMGAEGPGSDGRGGVKKKNPTWKVTRLGLVKNETKCRRVNYSALEFRNHFVE